MPIEVQVYRGRVDPANVARLLEIRPAALAQARAACPVLVGADLVRLDERTWLDILTWSEPGGVEQLMAVADGLPLVGEMHTLFGEVLSVDTGELVHTTAAAESRQP